MIKLLHVCENEDCGETFVANIEPYDINFKYHNKCSCCDPEYSIWVDVACPHCDNTDRIILKES